MILGYLKLLRPAQWIKNFFVLAPLVFSSSFLSFDAVFNATIATIFFCLASSCAYIVNDIHDIEEDRKHPIKRKSRPLASGLVSIPEASLILVVLYISLFLSYSVLPETVLVIAVYLLLNLAYTFFLKNIPVVDIFTIARGFVLRVYAGAMALSVAVSSWMFITTLCLALYLASIKRRQELFNNGNGSRKSLKFYTVPLVDRYAELSASGAIVFYSMFVLSSRPEMVVTIPFVLFGLFRYWYIVEIYQEGESPSESLLFDFQLLLTMILWSATCVWLLWPGEI